MLDGYIDIYLPDLKYFYNDIAKKYSKIENYFEIATKAIQEKYKQVGPPKLDENGIIKKGLIIRHLVLPNNIENSKKVLKWIKENIDNKVYVRVVFTIIQPTYTKSFTLNEVTYSDGGYEVSPRDLASFE